MEAELLLLLPPPRRMRRLLWQLAVVPVKALRMRMKCW